MRSEVARADRVVGRGPWPLAAVAFRSSLRPDGQPLRRSVGLTRRSGMTASGSASHGGPVFGAAFAVHR